METINIRDYSDMSPFIILFSGANHTSFYLKHYAPITTSKAIENIIAPPTPKPK